MLCSDDKHPDSLAAGHINTICARAVAKGLDVFNILQTACINPVKHYKLPVGLLNPGDPADFILVKDLVHFEVSSTYINGELVADNGISNIKSVGTIPINNFDCKKIEADALTVSENEYPNKNGIIPVIEALDGQLITNKLLLTGTLQNGNWVTNTTNDILKIVVVNRYHPAPIAKAFIKNFGCAKGAIASSVAHDSHNIVAVGVDDASIAAAINLVIEMGETDTIYNIGNGKRIFFRDIIGYAKHLIGGDGKLVPIEIPMFHQKVQVKSMWMNNDKLKSLGYVPKYDIREIVEDMVK
jgi:adenine deaminase